MSIILAVVSKYPDNVLCEYTEHNGNFLQISRMILQKVKPDTKYTILHDKHKFHYINENKITYLCLTENLNEETAFAFLNDIRKKLLNTYDYDKLIAMSTYQLDEFVDVLKQLMNYYNTHPLTTKTGELISDLNTVKGIMVDNIDKLLEREHKLDIIVTKSNNLNEKSHHISNFSTAVKRDEERKRNQTIAMVAGGVIIGVIVLYYFLD